MAEAFVDPLEAIDIHEQEAERNLELPEFLQPDPALVIHVAPVGQPGERVEEGHFLEFLDPELDGFLFGAIILVRRNRMK